MTKVSICIPAYNNLSQVKHLIGSIAEQTFKEIEIIITDDSTNSQIQDWLQDREAAERFSCLKQCRYQHNEKPLGHVFNWNEAMRLAKGDYIKIMFSDDWFTDKDSLEKFVKMLDDDPDASLAFCGSMQVSASNAYARCASDEFIDQCTKDYRHLITGNEMGAPSAVIYRSCDCFFDERSTFASDVFLYMSILKKNSHFVYTKEPLVSIGIHEDQYTCGFEARDRRKLTDYEILYQEYQAWENKACREFFLKEFVFPYGLGRHYAKDMRIPLSEYRKRQLQILKWNLTKGYPHAIKRRLGLGTKAEE